MKISHKTFKDYLRILNDVEKLGEELTPIEYRNALTGLVVSIAGNLPEDYWNEFIKNDPCGSPGCTCHLDINPKVIVFLSAMRDNYKKCIA